jgi:hypothetical protein
MYALQHALHEHSMPLESSQVGVVGGVVGGGGGVGGVIGGGGGGVFIVVVAIVCIGAPINFSIANIAVETSKPSASAPCAAALKVSRAPPAAAAGTNDTTVGGGEPVAPRSADMTAEPVVESTNTAPITAARAMVVKVARECIVQRRRRAMRVGRAR